MARPVETDFLHSFRYQVIASGTTEGDKFLQRSNATPTAQAGFSAVNTPSGTLDAVEYREGQYIYTRKYPGIPTMDDVTMSRGVATLDTDFYFWFMTAAEGTGEYRVDLTIRHYHRHDAMQGRDLVAEFGKAPEGLDLDSEAHKEYALFNAFPTAHKVAGDLDGTASEISIMDLTVSYERFEVKAGVVVTAGA